MGVSGGTLRIVVSTDGGDLFGRHFDHCAQARLGQIAQMAAPVLHPKGQSNVLDKEAPLQHRSQQAFTQRTLVILFDRHAHDQQDACNVPLMDRSSCRSKHDKHRSVPDRFLVVRGYFPTYL